MLRSPTSGSFSISRVMGACCILCACYVAVYGVHMGTEHPGVVASLAGVAGVALLTRDRAPETPEDEEGE